MDLKPYDGDVLSAPPAPQATLQPYDGDVSATAPARTLTQGADQPGLMNGAGNLWRGLSDSVGNIASSAKGALETGAGQTVRGLEDVASRIPGAATPEQASETAAALDKTPLRALAPAGLSFSDIINAPRTLKAAGEAAQASTTPEFKEATSKGILDPGGFTPTNIASKAVNTVAGMAAPMALSMVPGIGQVAGPAAFASQGEAAGREAGEQQVKALTDEQIAAIPGYEGMSPADARAKLSDDVANRQALVQGTFGGVLGVVGKIPGVEALGDAAAGTLSRVLSKPIANRVGAGIGEAAGFGGINAAGQVVGNVTNPIPTDTFAGVPEAAASGLAPGFAMGALRGLHAPAETKPGNTNADLLKAANPGAPDVRAPGQSEDAQAVVAPGSGTAPPPPAAPAPPNPIDQEIIKQRAAPTGPIGKVVANMQTTDEAGPIPDASLNVELANSAQPQNDANAPLQLTHDNTIKLGGPIAPAEPFGGAGLDEPFQGADARAASDAVPPQPPPASSELAVQPQTPPQPLPFVHAQDLREMVDQRISALHDALHSRDRRMTQEELSQYQQLLANYDQPYELAGLMGVSVDPATIGKTKAAGKDAAVAPKAVNPAPVGAGETQVQEAQRTPFDLPGAAQQRQFVADMQAHGVPDDVIQQHMPHAPKDSVTGFYDARADNMKTQTVQRAIDHVGNTGEPAQYVSGDIFNLGGLNSHVGNKAEAANVHYRAVSEILADELGKTGADVIPMRTGGDEVGALVVGSHPDATRQAVARAQPRISEYAKQNGLDAIPHSRRPGEQGFGMHIGVADIKPESTVKEVLDTADNGVNISKHGGDNVARSTAGKTGATSPEGQTGRAVPGVVESGVGRAPEKRAPGRQAGTGQGQKPDEGEVALATQPKPKTPPKGGVSASVGTITRAEDGTQAVHTSVGQRKFNDTDYDVGLLGSSQKDGTVVLQRGLDYTVPDKPEYSRIKGLDVRPLYAEHEAVERDTEDRGTNYSKSHYDHAIPAEHKMLLEKLGLKAGTPEADEAIRQYDAFSDEQVKQAAAVKNPKVAPDLLELPYEHPHNAEQRRLLAETETNKTNVAKPNVGDADAHADLRRALQRIASGDAPDRVLAGENRDTINAVAKALGKEYSPKASDAKVIDNLGKLAIADRMSAARAAHGKLPGGAVDEAARASAAHPEAEKPATPAQQEAGNHKMGHVDVHGMDVTIEVPKGGLRKGTNKAGVPWEREQRAGLIDRAGQRAVTVAGEKFSSEPDALRALHAEIDKQKGDDASAKYTIEIGGKQYTAKDKAEEAIRSTLGDHEPFEATIGDKTFIRRYDAAKEIAHALNSENGEVANKRVGTLYGFPLVADADAHQRHGVQVFTTSLSVLGKDGQVLLSRETEERPTAETTPQALRGALSGLAADLADNYAAKREADVNRNIENAKADIPDIKERLSKPFEYAQELADKRARLHAVVQELAASSESNSRRTPDEPAPPAAPGSFSKSAGEGGGAKTTELRAAIAEATKNWGDNAPDWRVVDTPEQLPAAAKRDPGYTKARGYYDGKTAYVVASKHADVEGALRTLAHEAVGHHGIENIVNDHVKGGWDQLAGDIDRLRTQGLGSEKMRAVLADVEKRYPGADKTTFAKETLAVMAERGIKNGLLARAVAAVRAFVRKLLPSLKFGEADLGKLLQHSDEYLNDAEGQRARQETVGAMAFDKAPPTDSPEFKKFFGSSKVVDKAGVPRVVFHGTGEDFSVFDPGKKGAATSHTTAPLGHFFTEDRARAARYAENASGGRPADERIVDAYLNVRKPYEMSLKEAQEIDSPEDAHALQERLRAEGYDGVHIKEPGTWIAFDNNQIKSASENRGTFDPNHPDITYRRTDRTADNTHDSVASARREAGNVLGSGSLERLEKAGVQFITRADLDSMDLAAGSARFADGSSVSGRPLTESEKDGVRGVTIDGTPHIVADNIPKGDVAKTIVHEVVHANIEQVLGGTQGVREIANIIHRLAGLKDKAGNLLHPELRAAVDEIPADTSPNKYHEEIIAHAGEFLHDDSLWRQIKDKVLTNLAKLGIGRKWADTNEALIRGIVRDTMRDYQNPKAVAGREVPAGKTAGTAGESPISDQIKTNVGSPISDETPAPKPGAEPIATGDRVRVTTGIAAGREGTVIRRDADATRIRLDNGEEVGLSNKVVERAEVKQAGEPRGADTDTTGIKNAKTAEWAAAHGQEHVRAEVHGREAAQAEARDRLARDPAAGQKLATELSENPRRAVTDTDAALMNLHLGDVRRAHVASVDKVNAMADSKDEQAKVRAQLEMEGMDAQLGTAERAGAVVRERWHSLGMALQDEVTPEGLFARWKNYVQARGGGKPLSAEAQGKIKELTDKIAKLEQQISSKRGRGTTARDPKERYAAIRAKLEEIAKRQDTAAAYARDNGVSFAEAIKRFQSDAPKPTAEQLAKNAKAESAIEREMKQGGSKQDDVAFARSRDDEERNLVRQMARALVEGGETDAQELVNRIHEDVGATAKLSRDMVRNIIAGVVKGAAPTKPELTVRMEAIRKELRAEYAANKQDSRRDTTRQKALRKQMGDIERRIKQGDFSKVKREAPKYSEDTFDLQRQVNIAKRGLEKAATTAENANKSLPGRIADGAIKMQRLFILSHLSALQKLPLAAVTKMAITPLEEAIGSALRRIPGLSRIAEMAPRHGHGFTPAAEAEGVRGIRMAGKGAGQLFRQGYDWLDDEYGSKWKGADEWSNLSGRVHSMMKEPAKLNEFYRSFYLRSQHARDQAIRDGMTPTRADAYIDQPSVKYMIGEAAYADAQEAIMQGKNALVDAIDSAVRSIGHSSAGGKVVERLFNILVPIKKVPGNIVKEATSYAGGGIKALPKLIQAVRKGVDSLTPEQADYVMKNLKRQSVGVVLMGIGYTLGPAILGGIENIFNDDRDEYKKRMASGKPLTGTAKVNGVYLNPNFFHAPATSAIQAGAQFRKMLDDEGRKATFEKGLGDMLKIAGSYAINEGPSIGSLYKTYKYAHSGNKTNEIIGHTLQGMVVPGLATDLAKGMDYDKAKDQNRDNPTWRNLVDVPGGQLHARTRYPQSVLQGVQEGIPFARNLVPDRKQPAKSP
jgi:hypothetical protein